MERSLEASQWRRSFAAGAMALGVSLGGHFATSSSEVTSCPLSAQRVSIIDRIGPKIGAPAIAQRVARVVLGLLGTRACNG